MNLRKRKAPKPSERLANCAHCAKDAAKVQLKNLPRHTERLHPGCKPREREREREVTTLGAFFQRNAKKKTKCIITMDFDKNSFECIKKEYFVKGTSCEFL